MTLRREPQSRGKGLLPICWRNPFDFSERTHGEPDWGNVHPCQVRPPDVDMLYHYQRVCRASVRSNSWSRSAPLGNRFAVIAATFFSLYLQQINTEQRFTTAITLVDECVCYSTGLGCRFTQLGVSGPPAVMIPDRPHLLCWPSDDLFWRAGRLLSQHFYRCIHRPLPSLPLTVVGDCRDGWSGGPDGETAEVFTWSINGSFDVSWSLGRQNTNRPLIRPSH